MESRESGQEMIIWGWCTDRRWGYYPRQAEMALGARARRRAERRDLEFLKVVFISRGELLGRKLPKLELRPKFASGQQNQRRDQKSPDMTVTFCRRSYTALYRGLSRGHLSECEENEESKQNHTFP